MSRRRVGVPYLSSLLTSVNCPWVNNVSIISYYFISDNDSCSLPDVLWPWGDFSIVSTILKLLETESLTRDYWWGRLAVASVKCSRAKCHINFISGNDSRSLHDVMMSSDHWHWVIHGTTCSTILTFDYWWWRAVFFASVNCPWVSSVCPWMSLNDLECPWVSSVCPVYWTAVKKTWCRRLVSSRVTRNVRLVVPASARCGR